MTGHWRTTAGAMALSAGLLAGCTVGPRFSPPQAETPSGWTGPGAAAVTGGVVDLAWWNSFGDPELTSLIARSQTANLTARQAVLRIDEARAQRSVAGAGGEPQVNAAASYANTRISERTATTSLLSAVGGRAPGGVAAALPGLSNPFDQYQYGLNASWEIDLFGRVRRTVEAADADVDVAVEDGRAVRVSLMAEVAGAYIDLRSAQAQRAVASESLITAQALLRLAQDARRADLGNDLDIASATAAAASAQAQLPPIDVQIAADKSRLALLVAAQPEALEGELSEARALPPLPPRVPVGLPSELARRRPDIRRAEAQLHAAVARQGVAVAALYPRLSLTGGAGAEASRPAALTDWAARYLTVGPSLDLPIFDAGQRRANIRIQDVRAKEAGLAYAQTVLGALHETQTAITAYDQTQQRRASLKIAEAQSRAALDIARRRYDAGSVSFREVLVAQDRLQQAEQALTVSTAATDQNLILLYRALGGGWAAFDG